MAYYASAELGCFLALGWPMPARILDLFAEFRAATNGLPTPVRRGPARRAASGTASTPWPPTRRPRCATSSCAAGRGRADERRAILDYCQADVDALAALLPRMLPGILGRQRDAAVALGQALLRGRYMAAAARMEWTGVPIDAAMLERLRAGWGGIKAAAGRGGRRALRRVRGHHLQGRPLRRLPRRARASPGRALASGALALDDDTFRDQAKA